MPLSWNKSSFSQYYLHSLVYALALAHDQSFLTKTYGNSLLLRKVNIELICSAPTTEKWPMLVSYKLRTSISTVSFPTSISVCAFFSLHKWSNTQRIPCFLTALFVLSPPCILCKQHTGKTWLFDKLDRKHKLCPFGKYITYLLRGFSRKGRHF